MPAKRANVKNEKQYEALKDKGMSKQRAARIANPPKPRATAARSPGLEATPSRAELPRSTRPPAAKEARPRQRRSSGTRCRRFEGGMRPKPPDSADYRGGHGLSPRRPSERGSPARRPTIAQRPHDVSSCQGSAAC